MSNPFEPLSAAEIQEAVAIFRQAHGDERAVFCSSGLEEPAKSEVKPNGSRSSRAIFGYRQRVRRRL